MNGKRLIKSIVVLILLFGLGFFFYQVFGPKYSYEIQGKVVKVEEDKLYIKGNYIENNKILKPEKNFVVSISSSTDITRIVLRKLTDEELKIEGGNRFKISKEKGTLYNILNDKIVEIDVFSSSNIYGTTTFAAFEITYRPL